jgi:hypothetical protein
VVTTPITAPCNALWLDPFQPAGERERDCLADAGLKLLPVRTLDDLRHPKDCPCSGGAPGG